MSGDATTRADLLRLTRRRAGVDALQGADAPAPILGKTALGAMASRGGAGDTGISSPLTADSVTSESRTLTSSDGLITLTYDHWLEITCHDADGREVILDLNALA